MLHGSRRCPDSLPWDSASNKRSVSRSRFRIRVLSSSVAAFVKVTTRIFRKSTPSSTRRTTRPVNANVFPVPALASIEKLAVVDWRRDEVERRGVCCGGCQAGLVSHRFLDPASVMYSSIGPNSI
jgi:hypothetical protein